MAATVDGPLSRIEHIVVLMLEPEDPDHSARAVDTQMNAGKMDGFVDAYASALTARTAEFAKTGVEPDPLSWATTTRPTCLSTITSPPSSASATTGTRPSRKRPGRTGCMH